MTVERVEFDKKTRAMQELVDKAVSTLKDNNWHWVIMIGKTDEGETVNVTFVTESIAEAVGELRIAAHEMEHCILANVERKEF